MIACEKYLGEYLGFEGVGILFKDTKASRGLFTLQPVYNEEEQKQIDEI
jgi:hypothetical protein